MPEQHPRVPSGLRRHPPLGGEKVGWGGMGGDCCNGEGTLGSVRGEGELKSGLLGSTDARRSWQYKLLHFVLFIYFPPLLS